MAYYREAVPENPDDLRRFIDNELRKITDYTELVDEYFGVIASIDNERAILRGSTTLTSNDLVSYPDSWIPTPLIAAAQPQLIELDESAGTITTGYEGIYDVSGYVAQSEGTNNQAYAWAVDGSTIGEFLLGTQVFTNATNGSIFSAAASLFLPADEVLKITTIDTLAGITVANSNLEVTMKSTQSFI